MPAPAHPHLFLDMGVSMQHKSRGQSIRLRLQGHIDTEHNRAQFVPKVGFILGRGQEPGHLSTLHPTTDRSQTRSTQPIPQGWMNRLAHPALHIPSLGVHGGRPRWCGRWGCAFPPGLGAGWCPPVESSAVAPAGPGGASAGPAAALHLGLTGQAGRVSVSLASFQGSPGPPPSCAHCATHAASQEYCVQWLLHTPGC